MERNSGQFEGGWKVVVGVREGVTLTVAKESTNPLSYKLSEGSTVLFKGLSLDRSAFTLKSAKLCLSLRGSCNFLFGMEEDESCLRVWCARRVSPGSSDGLPASGPDPDWRLGELWRVKTRQPPTGPVPPFERCDQVRIEKRGRGIHKLFKKDEPDPYDTLKFFRSNRTLDSSTRSMARWDRGAPLKARLFSMVIVPERLLAKIKEAPNVDEIKKILEDAGAYLPFEIEWLAAMLSRYSKPTDTIGVWGAEEGG